MTSYLQRYDEAKDEDKFRLVREWIDTEPLPFFKELREKRPVLETSHGTLFAHHDDVIDILTQPKNFTVELYVPKQSDGRYLMSHDDDALHTREKSLMQGFLNRDDLPHVREVVKELCTEILDDAKGNRIEAAYDYCRSVPAGLVQSYFGFTGIERKKLIEWSYWAQYDTFHNQPFDLRSDAEAKRIHDNNLKAADELAKYITELIAHRIFVAKLIAPWQWIKGLWRRVFGKPDKITDDIVARMLRTNVPAEVDFDIERVGVNVSGLLIGAVETTARAVALVTQYLMQHPQWYAQAKEAAQAKDPARFDGIVWEALRFVAPFPYTFRVCGKDCLVGAGTDRAAHVKRGTKILALTQSAVFDPRAFDNPDEFKPDRDFYRYFHFGFGSHECLGKYVGMVMIPEMVRQLWLRPNLKAEAPIDFRGGPFAEKYVLSWGE